MWLTMRSMPPAAVAPEVKFLIVTTVGVSCWGLVAVLRLVHGSGLPKESPSTSGSSANVIRGIKRIWLVCLTVVMLLAACATLLLCLAIIAAGST